MRKPLLLILQHFEGVRVNEPVQVTVVKLKALFFHFCIYLKSEADD